MPWYDFFWTDEIERHLAEHGVTSEQFESIVADPLTTARSRRHANRLIAWGYADDGRYLACVYELHADRITVIPVTAFSAPEPR